MSQPASSLDLAIATCKQLHEPDPDAAPLAAALARAGISNRLLPWDAPPTRWPAARMTLLRSTWNYAQHRDDFLRWAAATDSVSRLCNPLPVVRWNTHKSYLLELQQRGVPVTPTELLRQGQPAELEPLLQRRGWSEVVIKPAVSAASYRTRRFGPGSADRAAAQAHLSRLLAAGDTLVQRYLPSVERHGERALVWIAGQLTHAVRKSPRFEGGHEAVTDAVPVAPAEAALAQRAIQAAPGPLLYARVDLAPGPDNTPVLMELELTEPSLFFDRSPAALERFVAAIATQLRAPHSQLRAPLIPP